MPNVRSQTLSLRKRPDRSPPTPAVLPESTQARYSSISCLLQSGHIAARQDSGSVTIYALSRSSPVVLGGHSPASA